LGILTVSFDSQRAGILIIFFFFLAGYILLHRVDEQKGMLQGGYVDEIDV